MLDIIQDIFEILFVTVVQPAPGMDKSLEHRFLFHANLDVGPVHIPRAGLVVIKTAAAAVIARPTVPAFRQMIDSSPVVVI